MPHWSFIIKLFKADEKDRFIKFLMDLPVSFIHAKSLLFKWAKFYNVKITGNDVTKLHAHKIRPPGTPIT